MLQAAFQLLTSSVHLMAYSYAATVNHYRFITTNGSEFAVILVSIPIGCQFFHMMLFVAQRCVLQSLQADSITG